MLIHRNGKLLATAALLLFGVVMVSPPALAADETCEVPLFIKQTSDGANVMIMADNSGSMNTAVYHAAYDPDTRYSGTFYTSSTYYVSRDGWYNPKAFNRHWAGSPNVYLVNSDNGQSGRYDGNYLNWLFYNANDGQRANWPQVTRIQVLKSVLDQIVARSSQLDMGLTVFRSDNHGGKVLSGCGEDHGTIRSQIAGITANTWTPLGETMETILNYFGDSHQSPIVSSCQYNFILMVTDGLPTQDVDVSYYLHDADGDGHDPGDCASIGAPGYPESNHCSDHVDDVAWWMANRDVAGHIDDDQNVFTYVVGYNEDSQLLADTATNGQGLYFTANNAVDLFASIEYALQDILRRISAGSAVAVVSTERGTDDRLYRGKFMPGDWHGFLESYLLPYEDGDTAVWEAGSLLQNRSPGSRDIFTAVGGQMYPFNESSSENLRAKMGVDSESEANELIAWARGEEVDGYRDRQGWLLGDIIHSTPVVVGPPAEFMMEEGYTQFRQAHENRRKMVYVGANDGMIHSFDAETGYEAWAFVPEFALPKFVDMADSSYCHLYTCDQTVTVKDAQINGAWKTVMVAGGGGGGSQIFALDITYPDHPEVLWQSNLPKKKKFHSEVAVASIAGRPVALVGSGLDVNKKKSFIFAFDLSSGELLGKVRLSVDSNALRNKASKPATVDINMDGEADLVYMADLLGSMYRIDVSGGYNPDNWDVDKLYTGDQEIQADPVVAHGPNGAVYVYFGTGAFLEDPDLTEVSQNSFLCVFDQHSGSMATKNQMANQTNDIDEISGHMGWYVDLWNLESERVTQKAAVVAETVIFTSFAPNADACVAGGSSYLYQMSYDDGGIPDVDYMDDEEDRSQDLGDGVASHPVVDLSEGTVVVQSSDASISVIPIAGIIERLRVRSWQENYDHVEEPSDSAGNDLQ